jgi:hypothetical protein
VNRSVRDIVIFYLQIVPNRLTNLVDGVGSTVQRFERFNVHRLSKRLALA